MKRLTRSSNKMIGGVLSGFAEYIEVDPVWIRLGFVFFAIMGFYWAVLLLYIFGLLIIPKEDNVNADETKVKYTNGGYLIIGIGLIFFGVVFLTNQFFHINIWSYFNGFFYNLKHYSGAFILIALGILIIIKGKK